MQEGLFSNKSAGCTVDMPRVSLAKGELVKCKFVKQAIGIFTNRKSLAEADSLGLRFRPAGLLAEVDLALLGPKHSMYYDAAHGSISADKS
jgi:hypothetical protein